MPAFSLANRWKAQNVLLHNRWLWHVLFWIGYGLFRFYVYYITIKYFKIVFLEYMLLSELFFIAATYLTLWLYKKLFQSEKYLYYFLAGTACWVLYIAGRTWFQLFYLKNEPSFRGDFSNIVINNITVVLFSFLFITACKFFKDGYIAQQYEAKRKEEQLMAEVNNLKSQIAPHFLFNTLNNLYGLAVEKSDKLPQLMLRLSALLRHSLYETQNPLVAIKDEIDVLKSYIELETIRLEDDLKLEFVNEVPQHSQQQIAPLILIVFIENAFKHAKLVKSEPVNIYIKTSLENDQFTLTIKNNYNSEKQPSRNGVGLTNVKRRLEVLYPEHELIISSDEVFYSTTLKLPLAPATKKHGLRTI